MWRAFAAHMLQVRYPKVTPNHALLAKFGFEADSFLKDTLGPEQWQFWPAMKEAKITESWKKYPTGGEIYPETQIALWDAWPSDNGSQDVTTSIQTIHRHMDDGLNLFTTLLTDDMRANALRAARMMGYTLFCKEFSVKKNTVTVQIENRGVAPFYYAWPAEAVALDATGKEVGKGTATWPLPSLLPGNSADWSLTLDTLPRSAATVLLHIPNPMQGGHPVAFANAEMSTTRDGWLTLSLK